MLENFKRLLFGMSPDELALNVRVFTSDFEILNFSK